MELCDKNESLTMRFWNFQDLDIYKSFSMSYPFKDWGYLNWHLQC